MAGGTFDKATGKIRPGTYVNFEAASTQTVGTATRGTVAIPLVSHTWGAQKEFIVLSNASPDASFVKLGYSVYDDNDNMLLIREAFKGAQTVIVYNASTGGTKASGTGGGLVATAKYEGTRGNSLKFSVVANASSGFDVSVFLDAEKVEEFIGVTAVTGLADSRWVTFATDGNNPISAVASVSLTNGANATTANGDVTDFLDGIEAYNVNAICFPISAAALQAALLTKVKYLRENVGKGIQGVAPDFAADYEGIINVVNSVKIGSKTLTTAQACAFVAGITAGATSTVSNTYRRYTGATAVSSPLTNEQAETAITAGKLFFSYDDSGNVIVEYDINSLVTLPEKKNASYKKNRVIRTLDAFAEELYLNFPPNRYSNSDKGWDAMDGIGRSLLKQFADAGAIKQVDYEADFAVVRGESVGDSCYFTVGIMPVDSAEKLYFTVKTR